MADEGLWQERLARDPRRVVILDDDPTGTQTVSDVDVILQPSLEAYRQFFAGPNRAVFVLTNSRALTVDASVDLLRRIRDEVEQAAREQNEQVAFLLRGDSTLRGHVFAEIDALAVSDSVALFVPAFPEGGRITVNGVQYISLGKEQVPVTHTEFARDPIFGYRSERLVDWVSEVGQGRPAVSLPLTRLRSEGASLATAALLDSGPRTVVIPDAENRTDLEIVARGLLDAEARGASVVVRSASTFAAVRAGLYGATVQSIAPDAKRRTLIVCGSHTAASSTQLERLLVRLPAAAIVLPTNRLLREGHEVVLPHLVERVSRDLEKWKFAVLTTERVRQTYHSDLEIGARIMDGLTMVVSQVADRCNAVIAKGGITAAEVATKGLSATHARVQGQIEPGVSLWDLGLPDGGRIPYAVIPGNVGHDNTLLDVATRFGVALAAAPSPHLHLRPIEQRPMVTEITQRLLDFLLSGAFRPGDRLPSERRLSEALGTGRSTLREALKALTVLGLLDVRQGDGTYLKRADSNLLPRVIEWGLLLGEQRTMDLVEARGKLEVIIVELAAERQDSRSIEELRAILQRMSESVEDYQVFADTDVAFHLKLAEVAENQVLHDILSSIRALLRAWIVRTIQPSEPGGSEHRRRVYQEHVPIFEAIARHDSRAAVDAMRAHMQAATERLVQVVVSAPDISSRDEQVQGFQAEFEGGSLAGTAFHRRAK